MNEKSILPLLAAAALFTVLPNVSAVPTDYTIGTGSTISGNSADPGLVIKYALDADLDNVAFSLKDGDSYTFNFFRIWTDETAVNDGEDTLWKPITATFDFDLPTGSFGVSGETAGILGVFEYGKVRWGAPATFTAGGSTFSISLSNEEFNRWLFDLNPGEGYGATVKATVKQLSSGISIPDNGSTAMLLGLAFLSLAFIRRSKLTV